jgi:hypothetical protein
MRHCQREGEREREREILLNLKPFPSLFTLRSIKREVVYQETEKQTMCVGDFLIKLAMSERDKSNK